MCCKFFSSLTLILFISVVSAAQSNMLQEPARVGVDESKPLTLTLFDAIKMALENNREIEVERINVRQAEYDLFAARGARDIALTANSFYENRTIPVGSILAGGPNGTLTTKTLNYDLSLQQLLPSGGQWLAQLTNSRINSNSQFASLNPQYNAALSFQFTQPLVRNFSIDDSRRRIRIASRRLDLSDSQFRQRAIEVVSRVQQAYWELVFALKDLQIRREAVELARAQLERSRRMVKDGTLAPIELVSVEVELERRSEDVLTAIESVTRAENALKQLILGSRQSAVWKRPITPSDAPEVTAASFTLDEALAAAFANRPEMAQSALQQEINKVDVEFFENQVKPQINLVASYTTTGLSGTATRTINPFASTTALLVDRVNLLSQLAQLPPIVPSPTAQLPDFLIGGYGQSLRNLFINEFRTIRFGIALSLPLKNRAAESQLGRALAEGRKISAQRQALEQRIEAEVRNALQSAHTARQRVEAARASREAAEKQLESEQRRFAAGLSTTYFVLERQNALSQARGRELRALTDYSKAVSELQRVMGITLVSANVELVSATAQHK
jgi:outer membrane protein TolC